MNGLIIETEGRVRRILHTTDDLRGEITNIRVENASTRDNLAVLVRANQENAQALQKKNSALEAKVDALQHSQQTMLDMMRQLIAQG